MRIPTTVLVLALYAASAGCGSSGTDDPQPPTAASPKRTAAERDVFKAGRDVCGQAGAAMTAKELGLPATAAPYEIADAYGKEMSTGSFRTASAAGCYAGLRAGQNP